jgi:hypothetical protein
MRFQVAFRTYAAQCLELADATENEKHQAILRNMAQAWLIVEHLREKGDPFPLGAPIGIGAQQPVAQQQQQQQQPEPKVEEHG